MSEKSFSKFNEILDFDYLVIIVSVFIEIFVYQVLNPLFSRPKRAVAMPPRTKPIIISLDVPKNFWKLIAIRIAADMIAANC